MGSKFSYISDRPQIFAVMSGIILDDVRPYMPKKLDVCINHPDRYTNRHCYYCHKPICKECQIVLSHHIFCSKKCWYRFLLKEFLGRLKGKIREGKALLFSKNSSLLWVAIVFIFVILFWQNHRLFQKIDYLGKHVLSFAPKNTPSEMSPSTPGNLIVQKSPKQAMVFSNKITISGIADDSSIVILEQGGKAVAVTLSKKGKFVLKGVPVFRNHSRLRVKEINSNGEVLALEELRIHFAPPSILALSRPIRRGNPNEKKIALTFDGGSSNNITDKILDILHEKNVRCTMFLTGDFIRHFPETVRRIVREGHEVGNHTFHHPHLTTYAENRRQETRPGLTKERFQEELKKTAALFKKVTGVKMAHFWRAPYGESNPEIRRWAAELGYREVGWTVGRDQKENMDTRDWVAHRGDPGYQSGEAIRRKILDFAAEPNGRANGAIVLMHLASYRKQDFPYEKLPVLIDSLRVKGYQLVPVQNLFDLKNSYATRAQRHNH